MLCGEVLICMCGSAVFNNRGVWGSAHHYHQRSDSFVNAKNTNVTLSPRDDNETLPVAAFDSPV